MPTPPGCHNTLGAPASLPARSPREPLAGRDAGAPSPSVSIRTFPSLDPGSRFLCSCARGGVWLAAMKHAVRSLALAAVLGLAGGKSAESVKPGNIVKTNTPTVGHAHTNRLAREKSPYLLQHQHNPVDWYAWGEEAFAKARAENKTAFLSIGYSTCHWCHVMERESFENEAVAELLNRWFVSIKVDREERPDVDRIYMTPLQSLGLGGGWPLNAFLTPELEPFFGGTYFPPDSRGGRPGMLELLPRVHEAWTTRRDDLADT